MLDGITNDLEAGQKTVCPYRTHLSFQLFQDARSRLDPKHKYWPHIVENRQEKAKIIL